MKNMQPILKTENLCKSFGAVIANDHICMDLCGGEILAILGENGSGKTTLIHMLAGVYFPDSGNIYLRGKKVCIRSPKDADRLGIGVIYQHYKLVNRMSVVENIAIGLSGNSYRKLSQVKEGILQIAQKYNFQIDPDKKIYQMSVSEKQTVEIIKALMKGADILILDEPTAVLTPQEIKSLFHVLQVMKKAGKSIIIITHKLREVLEISDRTFIMRKGKCIDILKTAETSEAELTEKMVGKAVSLNLEKNDSQRGERLLSLQHISCTDASGEIVLRNVSFDMYGGEILGVAGIAGSGQRELCEAIAGTGKTEDGKILYYKAGKAQNITNKNPSWLIKNHICIGFVPEDRLGMGLISSAGMVDNMLLRTFHQESSFFLKKKRAIRMAENLIKQLDISTPDVHAPVRMLSGGNLQKVLLGRELSEKPDILIVAYPARGLDIHSTQMIYHLLNEAKSQGTAILFIGEDLDVLMQLSDRLLVLSDRQAICVPDPEHMSKDRIGYLMTKTLEEADYEKEQ